MASSLSSLTDNLAKGLHKATYKDFKPSLEYMAVKNGLLICKYVGYYKTFEKTFHGNLEKIFRNTYRFCNRDLKRIVLYCEQLLIHMKTLMAGKNSLKGCYPHGRNLQQPDNGKYHRR